MRFTQQSWDSIVARLELVVLGVGQVGLNPTVAIQRLADSQWLAAGGGAWGAGFAVNNLVQIDAANQPGMYEYVMPNARIDYVLSLAGYRCKYVEVGIPVLEYEYLGVKNEFSGLVTAGLATAGTNNTVTFNVWAPGTANYYLDMLVTIIDGTGKGQSRSIVAYSAGRVATVAVNWGVNPDATSVCVVHAAGSADLRAWLGTAPNALSAGNVQADVEQWRGVAPVNLVGAGVVVSDVELWRGVAPTVLAASGNVRGDLEEWRGVVPNNVVGGRVDADVGAIQPAPRDAIVDYVWDEALAGHVGAGSTGAALGTLSGLIGAGVLASGTVASTTGTTTTLDAGSAATASYYVNAKLVIISGTGAGQERVITGYTVGRVATHAAWTTNPTGASKYAIVPGLPSSLTIADIMTASMSSYETAGTFGNHVNRILRLRQENMRVVYTAWSTHGQPTAGYVLGYASSADLGTDVSPWALAKSRYDFTATYDGDLQLTGYQSARTL